MKTLELESVLTSQRTAKMKAVLARRLSWLTVVLDNVYDRHNISAVLRSCEAFGVQDIHVIESIEPFQTNREISHGTEKWLSIHRWPDYAGCLEQLRAQLFTVYATGFSESAVSLFTVPVTQPLAIVFGNEHSGVSAELKHSCDGEIMIPMCGFVESLNISVAAAVAVAVLRQSIQKQVGDQALLPAARREQIYSAWLQRQVHASRMPSSSS